MTAEARVGYRDRIDRLAAQARRWDSEVDVTGSDVETADEIVCEGLGPLVSLYVEHRTGDTMTGFSKDEYVSLERSLNRMLEAYCRCFGCDLELDYTMREAAELLVETHDARAVAEVLTKLSDTE